MYSRRAYNSADTFFSHSDLPAYNYGRVDTTNITEAEGTVRTDICYNKAHFVSMRTYHELPFGSFPSLFEANQISEIIYSVLA